MPDKKAFIVSNLCFEKNRSDSYTSKAFREHMERTGYSEDTKCVDRLIKGEYPKNIFFKIQGVILHA